MDGIEEKTFVRVKKLVMAESKTVLHLQVLLRILGTVTCRMLACAGKFGGLIVGADGSHAPLQRSTFSFDLNVRKTAGNVAWNRLFCT